MLATPSEPRGGARQSLRTLPAGNRRPGRWKTRARHLPYGAHAIVSQDGGKTWDRDRPFGWPLTVQLKDKRLFTACGLTAYLLQPPETTATEVVRWRLP